MRLAYGKNPQAGFRQSCPSRVKVPSAPERGREDTDVCETPGTGLKPRCPGPRARLCLVPPPWGLRQPRETPATQRSAGQRGWGLRRWREVPARGSEGPRRECQRQEVAPAGPGSPHDRVTRVEQGTWRKRSPSSGPGSLDRGGSGGIRSLPWILCCPQKVKGKEVELVSVQSKV